MDLSHLVSNTFAVQIERLSVNSNRFIVSIAPYMRISEQKLYLILKIQIDSNNGKCILSIVDHDTAVTDYTFRKSIELWKGKNLLEDSWGSIWKGMTINNE